MINFRKCALVCLLIFTACAAGPNNVLDTPVLGQGIAGFWLGLWHGTIAMIVFIISLFTDSVNIYEVHNNGGWYNFGFLIGVGAFVARVTHLPGSIVSLKVTMHR